MINAALRFLGLPGVDWLQDPVAMKFSLAILLIWRWTGYNAVIYLAGLQGIPEEYYEAARVDGARTWHLFRYISVPLLRRVILFTTVLSTIGILQLFAEPYLLVGPDGGTDYSLMTMMTYLYNNGFSYFKFGYASAMAYVMFVFIVMGSLLNLWIGRSKRRNKIDATYRGWGRPALHLFFIALSLVVLFPFYWMVIASTRSTADLLAYPPHLLPGTQLVANFQLLFATLPVLQAFFNSLFIASTSTVLIIFFDSLAGFAFAKYQFPGREFLFFLLLATLMLPGTISIIPWYIMMSTFGWVNDYRALIVPGIASAFGIFWMRQFIAGSVPDEMLQAARIDGCGHFGLYWRFVVPLSRAGLGTLALLTFLDSWNDFIQPLIILKDPSKFTMPIMLALLQNQYGTDLVLVMCAAALATVPILILFIFMSRQFIGGLTTGALKGA